MKRLNKKLMTFSIFVLVTVLVSTVSTTPVSADPLDSVEEALWNVYAEETMNMICYLFPDHYNSIAYKDGVSYPKEIWTEYYVPIYGNVYIFALSIEAGDELELRTGLNMNINAFSIQLRNSNGAILDRDLVFPGHSESVRYTTSTDGTYYLYVWGFPLPSLIGFSVHYYRWSSPNGGGGGGGGGCNPPKDTTH